MILMFENRFERVHLGKFPEEFKASTRWYEIHKDIHTGVLYYVVAGKTAAALTMTPLLDADGKPIIDKSE